MASLELIHVQKSFGPVKILHDISIDLADGEFLVLVGPSGCGKSTLMNIIAGLEEPSSGSLKLDQRDITQMGPADRNISMVFQSYALYPNMTVARNIEFPLQMRKVPKEARAARVQSVAKMLQIEHLLERRPRQLSGGQRQRVAIGRALAREPQLYLFDEPLSNLDAQLRVGMRTEIKKLHQRLKATIVYVTHDQIEAMTLATRIAVMKGGVLQQLGTPAQVYDQPANTFVAGFMGSPRMNLLKGRLQATGAAAPCIVLDDAAHPGCAAQIALPQALLTPALAGYVGQPVIAGIRPEAVALAAPDAVAGAQQAIVEARVEVVEPTGADTLALLDLGGQEFTVRLDPDVTLHASERARFLIDLRKLVCFDAQSEERIA
ncbi:ABC transporter ATP-binding protein [Verminephrobacter aporrectodeae subsp. tuberculatae]|uniref:ABC transporter ATP-binding protein n=1 Tax=Verminephrobacter aporrectodeae TaxID=1110389 RepID=UPI0022383EC5|nr:ABC transporter ATP-binding protein [Verminephrobacter aporrectodeae]MCW5220905.1 ABC transporter ATP-binding protein [Verminephrobacter aporrectodeae subsp. tuberculatae]MCW5255140.1 ABC transporter ATP-binding protein [Verminephrobacter aporrectodeae subsp. tuberculatae]MCW5290200.1 ABC transporter ATP-binding protein [Verminephrobacter aporrectodeae subsp. tuberculatae]